MKKNVKITITVLCLTLTCFLTQCESCLKKDEVTKKPLPHQVMYTISFGFPFPYFDVKVKTGPDDGFYYTIDCAYKIPVTMAVNIPALALVFSLVLLLIKKGRVQINRLLAITVTLTVLFNSSLLIPYFPAFFETVFGYIYVYPIAFIGRLFELVSIELPDNNIPPRIYLAFLVPALYALSIFLPYLVKLARARLSRRG